MGCVGAFVSGFDGTDAGHPAEHSASVSAGLPISDFAGGAEDRCGDRPDPVRQAI